MTGIKEFTYEKSLKLKKWIKERELGVDKQTVLSALLAFALALAMPLPQMAPFGVAYLAQERRFSKRAVLYFLLAGVGSVIACDRLNSAKYIMAGLIYLSVLFVLKKEVRLTDTTAGLVAGLSTVISGIAVVFVEGASVFAVILLLCEGAVVASASLMMERAVVVIRKKPFLCEKLDTDAKVSLCAVIMILVLSFREVYLGGEFSIMNVIGATLLLIVACGSGANYSAVAGVILGAVCGIGGDFFMPVLGAFALCGFMSGIFSKFGKGGAIAGIILANGIMVVYTNNAMEAVLSLYEVVAASVVFAFIPYKVMEGVRTALVLNQENRQELEKLKSAIKLRLKSAAATFEAMAKSLERLTDKKDGDNSPDVTALFDAVAHKVCRKCKKSMDCWGKNFNGTYDVMFNMFGILKEKGAIKKEDVEPYFGENCSNMDAFLQEFEHQFDIYRTNRLWESKLRENRSLVGKQLDGISQIIGDIALDVDRAENAKIISPRDVSVRMEAKGIRVLDASVDYDKFGRPRIELVMKERSYGRKTKTDARRVVQAIVGGRVEVTEECFEGNRVRLSFGCLEKFEVEAEYAGRSARDENGDNYRLFHLESGKYVIAISDGMGTGEEAARESRAMLELLDSFLQAGFECGNAVRLINSIMLMKSGGETFATLDLCIIDLYTGEAKFLKTGAEPSFILDKYGRVKTIRSESLPMGLVAEAEAGVKLAKMYDGDSLIMVTDGVENNSSATGWIGGFIEESQKNPQSGPLAKEILNRAIQRSDGTVKDDMTVLSVKLKAVS